MQAIRDSHVGRRRPLTRRIDMRVDEELFERLEAQASRLGLSVSAYIRLAMTERLERDEDTEPDSPR
jgi:predicted HicB family RNase H-like nuclease